MKPWHSAFLAGTLFGVGLVISGMTDPQNIIAFLDVAGHWSPNLAGVMLGAIAVHATWLHWSARHDSNPSGPVRSLAPGAKIDGALLVGSALFGVGWGLSGYCPGPSIVALGSGALAPFVFVVAMLGGMLLNELLTRGRRRQPMAPDLS